MNRSCWLAIIIFLMLAHSTMRAQSSELDQPWTDTSTAIVIDPYQGNHIDWDQLATDARVVAIIHRGTIGRRRDTAYAGRREIARERGYKWGSYHLGRPGDPIEQADFYLETVGIADDELLALDIESLDSTTDMSLADAVLFIERIHEKSGRYPLLYGNDRVIRGISSQYGPESVFAKIGLWYARFRRTIPDFPAGVWTTYTLWQFSCEINCRRADRAACLYTVPGTAHDMDINVYNGTVEELRSRWPFGR